MNRQKPDTSSLNTANEILNPVLCLTTSELLLPLDMSSGILCPSPVHRPRIQNLIATVPGLSVAYLSVIKIGTSRKTKKSRTRGSSFCIVGAREARRRVFLSTYCIYPVQYMSKKYTHAKCSFVSSSSHQKQQIVN